MFQNRSIPTKKRRALSDDEEPRDQVRSSAGTKDVQVVDEEQEFEVFPESPGDSHTEFYPVNQPTAEQPTELEKRRHTLEMAYSEFMRRLEAVEAMPEEEADEIPQLEAQVKYDEEMLLHLNELIDALKTGDQQIIRGILHRFRDRYPREFIESGMNRCVRSEETDEFGAFSSS